MKNNQHVLVIGGGGREHALAWKLAQSAMVEQVYITPGNAGTFNEANIENIECQEDVDSWVKLAKKLEVDLVLIGPELPLVMGLADALRHENIPVFGPNKSAAALEGSKAFAKDFMAKYNIPTASYQVFEDEQRALTWLEDQSGAMVVKADGLAAGKGVILCDNVAEAKAAVSQAFDGKYGAAGSRVVIEQFLKGEEASYICIVAGDEIVPMASSQDHKARDDGDKGPNTGGMGAYSPAPVVTSELERKILDLVIKPVIAGLKEEGLDYVGFLYAGIMIGKDGMPMVLEFNCRFGDPETQPIMTRLKSDLFEVLYKASTGESIKQINLEWDGRVALGVVLAAGGYPDNYQKGYKIEGLDSNFGADIKIFHAGTKQEDDKVLTAGGRVLCVTALGQSTLAAQQRAYEALSAINWEGVYYRKDIGHRAINRS